MARSFTGKFTEEIIWEETIAQSICTLKRRPAVRHVSRPPREERRSRSSSRSSSDRAFSTSSTWSSLLLPTPMFVPLTPVLSTGSEATDESRVVSTAPTSLGDSNTLLPGPATMAQNLDVPEDFESLQLTLVWRHPSFTPSYAPGPDIISVPHNLAARGLWQGWRSLLPRRLRKGRPFGRPGVSEEDLETGARHTRLVKRVIDSLRRVPHGFMRARPRSGLGNSEEGTEE